MKPVFAYPKTKTVTADVIAAEGYLPVGCKVSGGKIVPALSAMDMSETAFAEVKAAGASAAANAFMVCADNKVYYSSDGLNFSGLIAFEGERPFIVEQRDGEVAKLYAVDENSAVFFGNGSGGKNTLNRNIYAGQMKNGRLFCADCDDNFKLRWSGEGGLFDWEEKIDGAGWLYFDGAAGRILNLLTYGEKLIAVRENGLSVLSAFGTPENFKAEGKNLYVSGIRANTAAVAANKLIFFADGGLHMYNGAKITEVKHKFAKKISNPVCAVSDGSMYCLSAYIEPLCRRAVLVYDAESGEEYVADAKADALVASGGIFAYSEGLACKLGLGGNFAFKSGNVNFGTSRKKCLLGLEIGCGGTAEIEICADGSTRRFSAVKNALHADMRGVNFTFTVKSDSEITFLKAYAEVMDGV